jgi:hypothetical protein
MQNELALQIETDGAAHCDEAVDELVYWLEQAGQRASASAPTAPTHQQVGVKGAEFAAVATILVALLDSSVINGITSALSTFFKQSKKKVVLRIGDLVFEAENFSEEAVQDLVRQALAAKGSSQRETAPDREPGGERADLGQD